MVFQPGQTGNPNGRPKNEWTWASLLKEEADKLVDEANPTKGNVKKAITKAVLKKASEGDVQAFREIANRTDGMPLQKTDVTSDGKPLPILNVISSNNSNPEDSEAREED